MHHGFRPPETRYSRGHASPCVERRFMLRKDSAMIRPAPLARCQRAYVMHHQITPSDLCLRTTHLLWRLPMTFIASHSAPHFLTRALLATLALASAACGTGEKRADTTAPPANAVPAGSSAPAMPSDSSSGAQGTGSMSGMGQMANMTRDADHDFLRMMSDHHKGLILMAHMTTERKEGGSAVADAKKLDAAQDKELDHMVTMLETEYK